MFTGFTPETIDFLWGIRMNNNRDWFLEHKKQYVSTLYEPMKALGKDLFAPFMEIPGTILKVSRIYRDARLHHPDPYKESLWLCIRQDVEWWAENPCLFFEINPEGVSYGFTLWHPRTAAMEEFRKYISAYPDEFLHLIAQTEAAVGQPVTAQLYKRPRKRTIPRLRPISRGRAALSASATRTWGTKCSARNWKTKWRTSSPSSRRCTRISPGLGCKTAL